MQSVLNRYLIYTDSLVGLNVSGSFTSLLKKTYLNHCQCDEVKRHDKTDGEKYTEQHKTNKPKKS